MLTVLKHLLILVMAGDGTLQGFLDLMHLLLYVICFNHGACVFGDGALNFVDHLFPQILNKHGKLIVSDVLQVQLKLWHSF